MAIALIAIFAGLQLVWTGAHTVAMRHTAITIKVSAPVTDATQTE
ncbi:MAG: hypothetical protein ACRD4Q_02945 [Candidatus Acidiferrales bacterium]